MHTKSMPCCLNIREPAKKGLGEGPLRSGCRWPIHYPPPPPHKFELGTPWRMTDRTLHAGQHPTDLNGNALRSPTAEPPEQNRAGRRKSPVSGEPFNHDPLQSAGVRTSQGVCHYRREGAKRNDRALGLLNADCGQRGAPKRESRTHARASSDLRAFFTSPTPRHAQGSTRERGRATTDSWSELRMGARTPRVRKPAITLAGTARIGSATTVNNVAPSAKRSRESGTGTPAPRRLRLVHRRGLRWRDVVRHHPTTSFSNRPGVARPSVGLGARPRDHPEVARCAKNLDRPRLDRAQLRGPRRGIEREAHGDLRLRQWSPL